MVVGVIAFVGTTTFVYHSLRQLRLIGRVHRYIESIDLLHLQRLHAFGGVTATTGVVLVALSYLAVPTNTFALTNPVVIAFAIGLIPLAIASFVVPLYGIHGSIAAEKSRRLEAVNQLVERA